MSVSIGSSASGGAARRLAGTLLLSVALTGGLTTNAQAAHHGVSVSLRHRTLTITGTAAANRLGLRLAGGLPQRLVIDVRDDGSPDFQILRSTFDRIRVNAGAGNDLVRIDDSNGAFTTTTPTQINGGRR